MAVIYLLFMLVQHLSAANLFPNQRQRKGLEGKNLSVCNPGQGSLWIWAQTWEIYPQEIIILPYSSSSGSSSSTKGS